MRYLVYLSTLITLFSVSIIAAQPATCAPLLETALNALDTNCGEVTRNQACYGYNRLTTTFAEPTFDTTTFDKPADLAPLTALKTIQTAPLNEETDEWGVALLAVQANLPATLPGQNVIFVVMGDAALTVDDSQPDLNPMQAFYFTTGVGNPTCTDSPNTLLIQSPASETVELSINGTDITLSSTAFMTLVEDAEGKTAFELTMAEGEAVINGSMIVPEGHWARIPLATDAPLDDGWLRATDETPFCRPTPPEHLANFESIVSRIPTQIFAEVDTIVPDERGCHQLHVVAPGENLFRIGLTYGVDWEAIAALNNLENARQITVGQTLLIPYENPD